MVKCLVLIKEIYAVLVCISTCTLYTLLGVPSHEYYYIFFPPQ